MLNTHKLLLFINRFIYILSAAMLISGLILTISQQPVAAQSTCGPNQELNNKGECTCSAGYMFTVPDQGDTTAPFCIPTKVTVCHRNNGGVGYSAVDVSINSVTSNEDWWVNGHGQHTIAGGEVGFPEDAWPDFYAKNGDFIAAYGDQSLVANGCAAAATATPTATNTPTQVPTSTPTNTPTNTPTSTPANTATNTPTSTPTNTPPPGATLTPTSIPTETATPGDPVGGEQPTPVPTLGIPQTGVNSSAAANSALIPVTGMDITPGMNKLTFGGLGLLGLGLVMSGIRRKYNL